eukprot:CAMPEP_0179925428 /NCGR_PEP_ID=MMETSP0983-20121128/7252_1 /TAXON_ID=483367 /ORGANISM="non described non described, Strain CCMP 2436" /LENGTH=118 /DNA_ID=CAMNT_0021829011 /DNA_START=750 /DNA_END=1105 /DNA_ORIENTATION=-
MVVGIEEEVDIEDDIEERVIVVGIEEADMDVGIEEVDEADMVVGGEEGRVESGWMSSSPGPESCVVLDVCRRRRGGRRDRCGRNELGGEPPIFVPPRVSRLFAVSSRPGSLNESPIFF